jgi:hypothetical protein
LSSLGGQWRWLGSVVFGLLACGGCFLAQLVENETAAAQSPPEAVRQQDGLAAVPAASTYYLSPAGDDGRDGRTPRTAWRSFAHAVPRLKPGDTLLLRPGRYTRATTGLPVIDCAGSAHDGSAERPIVLRAEKERQAFLDNPSGLDNAFRMTHCRYWRIEGLYLKGGNGRAHPGDLFLVSQSEHVQIRRLLATRSNTCSNVHVVSIEESKDVLLEESEVYDFHRHGIHGWRSRDLVFRRNYVNGRDGGDQCASAYKSGDEARADEGLSFYRSSGGIMENNVAERVNGGLTCHGGPVGSCDDSRFLGNVALNTFRGFGADTRCRGLDPCPADRIVERNLWENDVAYNEPGVTMQYGFWFIATVGATMRNNTVIGFTTAGIRAQLDPPDRAVRSRVSLAAENTLLHKGVAFPVDVEDFREGTSHLDYVNVSQNRRRNALVRKDVWCPTCFEHVTERDARLGTCTVFIPSTSPLKGAGQDGADIGANILYRYRDGQLSAEPLWDPATGAFPCGAVVPGVNDRPGSSCSDVHLRLHVAHDGCQLPPRYGK